MAKNNMLLGYARGKVGDLVFQRRKGEQIVKARNRNPNNPRTWSQQMQRVRMYAPVAFYKKATENFYRFAFEDKKPNETDYNAFIRENLNAFQGPYFTKEQVAQNFPVVAPYIISSGKLGDINAELLVGSGKVIVKSLVSEEVIEMNNRNVGYVSRQLINRYNLQDGDMLTFVALDVKGIKISENGNVNYDGSTDFYYRNFVINTSSTQTINTNFNETDMQGIRLIVNEEGKPSTYLSAFGGENVKNDDIIGYAVITTRRSNGRILASRTTLKINEAAKKYFETMSTSQQLLKAAASYDAKITALDPNSAKMMNETTSQTNNRQDRSTKQTAMNCLPNGGTKTTEGIPPYTLDNECQSCGCPAGEPEPQPCIPEPFPYEQETSSARRSSRKTSQSNASE